jgi:putative chitinase
MTRDWHPYEEQITAGELMAALGIPEHTAEEVAPALSRAMFVYQIDTPERKAAFIAQLAHESAMFRTYEEYASGEDYEGRRNLGNIWPGDGVRFKGHGWIQITGRHNHQRIANRFGLTIDTVVEWLMTPMGAALSAGQYWSDNGLNKLADEGKFETITRRINGGLNGHAHRVALWERSKLALAAV